MRSPFAVVYATGGSAPARRAGGPPAERPSSSPRSIRPGCTASSRPNSSTVDNAVRCPSWTAPEPIRIVEVAEAVSASTTAGEVPALRSSFRPRH